MRALKRHPFPVVAWFERVVAVSFAFPEQVLRPLVPAYLEIDAYEGLGFVTVSLVWTRSLRPAGFPEWCGQDFFLAGYRVFTRLREPSGRRLRGLRILRSETDRWTMECFGNLMTHYNYRRVTVRQTTSAETLRIQTTRPSGRQTLDVTVRLGEPPTSPPAGSPFPDLHTARQFAGPMPFTFSPEDNGTVLVIEGSRQNWTPRPVAIDHSAVSLFDQPPFVGTIPILANAFTVESVPYRWERGRLVHIAPV